VSKRAAKAEAAAWLARLRADDRSSTDERAFQAWLAESADHAHAFEMVTTIWESAGALAPQRDERSKVRRPLIARRAVLAGLGTTAFFGVGFGAWEAANADVYETGVGEQKHVALDDGTQMFLDTDTRVWVDFTKRARKVRIQRGRVNVHIAPDPERSFVVEAADQRIVAAEDASSLDVQRDGANVSVVMLQGAAEIQSDQVPNAVKVQILGAGQRLTAVVTAESRLQMIRIDKLNLAPLIAWQSGQAIFEKETLAQAVDEMNRYSLFKLAIIDAPIASLRLSGVYRVGDNVAFANSIATLLPVSVTQTGGRVGLRIDHSRTPQG